MSDNYSIVTVKSIDTFEPKLWLDTFNKPLTQNIIEAKIIFTDKGLMIPLKRYAINPQMQTLEFAGLHSYNERSKHLIELLSELIESLLNCYITRADIAMDYKCGVQSAIIKQLCKDRYEYTPKKYPNTRYYKSQKEKKTNTRINIIKYIKSNKFNNNLVNYLERLELSFRGGYFNRLQLKDLDQAIVKMEKSIKRFVGIRVKIKSF